MQTVCTTTLTATMAVFLSGSDMQVMSISAIIMPGLSAVELAKQTPMLKLEYLRQDFVSKDIKSDNRYSISTLARN